jgi:putative membrane protein
MNNFLNGPGFLGTNANFRSDASLILILITAVLFTIGWRLAIQKRYEAHRWVQTIAACLNAIVVLSTMISSFMINILPGIPGKLNQGSYAVTTTHGLAGMIGLVLGIFVVLRGNELVPKSLRFANYKLVMRTSYALYMLVTLMGVVVYVIVFVVGS